MGTEPHPLFIGKTPLELEQMSYEDLSRHLERCKQYEAACEVQLLVKYIIFSERRPFDEYPRGATKRYQAAWQVAVRRVGLKLSEITTLWSS